MDFQRYQPEHPAAPRRRHVVTVGSDNPERPWGLTASIKPTEDGYRSIALEARQVSADDLLLASRLGDGTLQLNVPLSASLRGVIGPNGVPQSLTGRVVADAGYLNDDEGDDGRLASTTPSSRSIGMPAAVF